MNNLNQHKLTGIYKLISEHYSWNEFLDLIDNKNLAIYSDGYSVLAVWDKEYMYHWGDWTEIKEWLNTLSGVCGPLSLDTSGLNCTIYKNRWRII